MNTRSLLFWSRFTLLVLTLVALLLVAFVWWRSETTCAGYEQASLEILRLAGDENQFLEVELDEEYRSLSVEGIAYLIPINGEHGVLFVSAKGKGSNFEGLMYAKHLDLELLERNYYGKPTVSIPVTNLHAEVELTRRQCWYRVSFRLD